MPGDQDRAGGPGVHRDRAPRPHDPQASRVEPGRGGRVGGGFTKSYLSMLERGQRGFNRRGLIEDLAGALGCSVTDLTGQPYLPVDRDTADSLTAVPGIQVALHNCGAAQLRPRRCAGRAAPAAGRAGGVGAGRERPPRPEPAVAGRPGRGHADHRCPFTGPVELGRRFGHRDMDAYRAWSGLGNSDKHPYRRQGPWDSPLGLNGICEWIRGVQFLTLRYAEGKSLLHTNPSVDSPSDM